MKLSRAESSPTALNGFWTANIFYPETLTLACRRSFCPVGLCGFRRYFEAGRARALVGAGLALSTQNLSCGYCLFFFAPFVAAYLVYELLARRRCRAGRTLGALAVLLAASPQARAFLRGLPGSYVGFFLALVGGLGAWLVQHGVRLLGEFEYDRPYELGK